MKHAACFISCATCVVQYIHAPCVVRPALYNVSHTSSNMQRVACNMRRGTCNTCYATCKTGISNMQAATIERQYAAVTGVAIPCLPCSKVAAVQVVPVSKGAILNGSISMKLILGKYGKSGCAC